MLVLSRKVGEQIVVPRCQLTITVLGIIGGRVRLGVSAPPEVAVHRQEIEKRIRTEACPAVGETLMSMRILIADPDHFLVTCYNNHLRERDATVSTAMSGLECMARLRDAVPDVLVLDPSLPWGGGEGILALMNDEPALRPRVVMILAPNRNQSALYRLSRFKVDDYQTKPLTADKLTQRICALLASAADDAVLSR